MAGTKSYFSLYRYRLHFPNCMSDDPETWPNTPKVPAEDYIRKGLETCVASSSGASAISAFGGILQRTPAC